MFAFPWPVIIGRLRRLHRCLLRLVAFFALLCFAYIVQQLVMTVWDHAVNDIMPVHDIEFVQFNQLLKAFLFAETNAVH